MECVATQVCTMQIGVYADRYAALPKNQVTPIQVYVYCRGYSTVLGLSISQVNCCSAGAQIIELDHSRLF